MGYKKQKHNKKSKKKSLKRGFSASQIYQKRQKNGFSKKIKKNQTFFQKSVDKIKSVCYTSGALLRKRQHKRSLKIEQQRFMID